MISGFKNFIKRVGVFLNIIKEIETVSDIKEINIDSDFYREIDKWRSLYKGYYEPIHKVYYEDVEGVKNRCMSTLNLPKVVANEMASLVFNERCDISVSSESNDGWKEFVQDVFKQNNFYSTFQQRLEYAFALGGIVPKGYVDDGVIRFKYVTQDCFVPLKWNHKEITDAVFIDTKFEDNKWYTLLEFQEIKNVEINGVASKNLVIRNELYESKDKTTIGTKVPLSRLYPELESEVVLKGVKRPLFTFIKPNTANNFELESPLGISLFANAIDTIKQADTIYDSLTREFVLGKKRILVPDYAIQKEFGTSTVSSTFDPSKEVYEALSFANQDNELFKEISFDLRVNEHIEALNAALNELAMQCGFSSGTFTFDGRSMKTATEVISENSKTFKSKKSHENIIEQGITDMIEIIAELAELYGLYPNVPKDYEVTVTFDDSIIEDEKSKIQKEILLLSANLQSKVRALATVHGLTEEEALQLKQEIDKETSESDAFNKEQYRESILFGDA